MALRRELLGAGIPPDVTAYNACVQACEDGQAWEQAVELLWEMLTSTAAPDVFTMTPLCWRVGAGSKGRLLSC